MIYLDYNGTTPLAPEALNAMLPYFTEHFANPSSGYRLAEAPREALASARREVAALIGCKEYELFFTGGGTESNNLALRGVLASRGAQGRRELICSAVEHPAVLAPCRQLQREGYSLVVLPVDGQGRVRPEELASRISERTALVSVMHANNEVGTIEPIAELAAIAHRHGALMHCDAAQSCGKISVSVAELGVDLLSMAAHKLYGPKGIGALFVRSGIVLEPLLRGANQEHGLRPGTENVPAIVGFGRACTLARESLAETTPQSRALVERLWAGLVQGVGAKRLRRNGAGAACLPNTLSVALLDADGPAIVAALAERVALSAGAACKSGSTEVSAVLAAMGVEPRWARGTLRLSVGRGSSPEAIDEALAAMVELLLHLRAGGGNAAR